MKRWQNFIKVGTLEISAKSKVASDKVVYHVIIQRWSKKHLNCLFVDQQWILKLGATHQLNHARMN